MLYMWVELERMNYFWAAPEQFELCKGSKVFPPCLFSMFILERAYFTAQIPASISWQCTILIFTKVPLCSLVFPLYFLFLVACLICLCLFLCGAGRGLCFPLTWLITTTPPSHQLISLLRIKERLCFTRLSCHLSFCFNLLFIFNNPEGTSGTTGLSK